MPDPWDDSAPTNLWFQQPSGVGGMPGPQGAPDTPAPPGITLNSMPAGIGSDANIPITGQPIMADQDRDNLIKTIYGEASGEPALGQAGVAHAIFNRLAAGGYGNSITDIVHAPVSDPKDAARGFHEFSPWNPPGVPESNPTAQHLSPNSPNPTLANAYTSIGNVVDKAYYGITPDPTGGATHYYGYMPHGPPKWAGPLAAQNRVKIGNQTFIGGAEGPGRSSTIASTN